MECVICCREILQVGYSLPCGHCQWHETCVSDWIARCNCAIESSVCTSLHVMIFGVLETHLRHICACVLNMPWSSPTTLQISSYSSSLFNAFWSLSKEIYKRSHNYTVTGAGILLQVVFLYRTDTEAWTGRLLTLDTVSTDADLYNYFLHSLDLPGRQNTCPLCRTPVHFRCALPVTLVNSGWVF